MDNQKLLELKNLVVGTETLTIIHDISLFIREGEIMGIIGESGSGKSTLLRSVLHLPYGDVRIKSGLIFWKGKKIADMQKDEAETVLRKKISIIYQSLSAAFDPITKIKKQYLEAVRSRDRTVSTEAVIKKAAGLLQEINLTDEVLNAYPFELSGGMLQRAAIVMAMLNDPDLILADEMTSALDILSQEQVIEAVIKIRKMHHTAVLFVTHNMSVIRKTADKVAVMYGGRIVECGKKEDVLEHPAHPYTKALIHAVPKLAHSLPEGIPGEPPEFLNKMDFCPYVQRCPAAQEKCRHGFPKMTMFSNEHYAYCNTAGIKPADE